MTISSSPTFINKQGSCWDLSALAPRLLNERAGPPPLAQSRVQHGQPGYMEWVDHRQTQLGSPSAAWFAVWSALRGPNMPSVIPGCSWARETLYLEKEAMEPGEVMLRCFWGPPGPADGFVCAKSITFMQKSPTGSHLNPAFSPVIKTCPVPPSEWACAHRWRPPALEGHHGFSTRKTHVSELPVCMLQMTLTSPRKRQIGKIIIKI